MTRKPWVQVRFQLFGGGGHALLLSKSDLNKNVQEPTVCLVNSHVIVVEAKNKYE